VDKEIRNKIKKMVQDARKALLKEIGELLEGAFGLHKDGTIEDISRLPQIKDDQNVIKAREGFAYVIERETVAGSKRHEAVERLILGLTFTHLNRLVALKLMERRKVIRETVSRGSKSNGFVHYVVDVLKKTDLSQLDDIDIAYQDYILYQCREVAEEIKVLFDQEDLSSYVFPRPRALKAVLEIINNPEIDNIWDFDETIGWIYQYFTPKEIREQARAESSAPRNSWELAFRNQFYTPRYVVQFLTDNTLGRMWYEIMQGNTRLSEYCEYMVKPRNEVFLQRDEKPAAQADSFQVPFREKKDPRLLKILDPACGSGHFLLYVFNLLMIIYREAYDDKDLGIALQKDYPDKDAFEREIPRLILENNLYGIDIDLRAIQIAALALWLRAQREWVKIRREDRPRVRNAHFICAEPMPGNQKLFEDFVSTLKPALLGDLVRNVWEKMKLAGEAGSLLQIEQELRAAIQEAKRKWEGPLKPVQVPLFGKSEPRQLSLSLSEIKDEDFFKEAEEKVFSALRDYAEKVKAENHGYSRRLFAEESIRGFQFVEVLQNRFDVVLMNPPFGAASLPSRGYIDKTYPRTKNDVYAAFVERILQLLHDKGFIGIISSRTGFFLSSFTKWREEILMKESSLHAVADFGFGVLEAMVETAAYTVEKTPATGRKAVFFRVLKDDIDAKGEKLLEAIQNAESEKRFDVQLDSFSLVPNTPFSYWVSDRTRNKFKEFPPFEGHGGTVKQGLATADDFRFVRVNWEVKPTDINAITWADWLSVKDGNIPEQQNVFVEQTTNKRWANFAKGGEYSPYYSDIHLVVNWKDEGREIKNLISANGRIASRPQNMDYYFRAGLTYTSYTNLGFAPKILPSGCVFSHAGNSIFLSKPKDLMNTIGLFNSKRLEYFLRIMTDRRKWEVGYVQNLPYPQFSISLKDLSIKTVNIKVALYSNNEITHVFNIPSLNKCLFNSISEASKNIDNEALLKDTENGQLQSKIDNIVYNLYNIDPKDRLIIEKELAQSKEEQIKTSEYAEEELDEISISENISQIIENLLMWCIGVVFGRWDVRMALDKSLIPKLADPFDPLPVCSPGMLLSPDGYPATLGSIVSEAWLKRRVNVLDVPTDVPNPTIADKDYPIQVDWDGILVDDEGHSDDIVKKVHEVLVLIYGEHADEREREILEILDVKSLRDYFRQPKRFFDFHIKRYSKSRRKAPIYWLLQTKKKNYGIWLYYHKLDNDTLFKILRNYIEPKLNLISSQILEVSQKVLNTDGRDKLTYEKELEKLEELRQEITEFKEELEKVAKMGYDPNFDDGVILNMAPLHTVIPWNEPAKYWKDLESGKYDWARIAMKYWPERVKAKCKKDKSLAIAHGYE
jgi:hypothetical protein